MSSSAIAPVPPRSASGPPARWRICLILEGTYPYVSGGVSTWVHQIIDAMPDFEFSIHFLGDQKRLNAEYKYDLPDNVTSVTESYLFDPVPPGQDKPGRGGKVVRKEFRGLIDEFVKSSGAEARFEARFEALFSIAKRLRDDPRQFTLADLGRDEAVWELLTEAYQDHSREVSFLRYHSSVRDLATLIWKLLLTAGTLPTADVYHCVCTGYAGLLGAIASRLHDCDFLLSEHGVYLKERIEDLRKSTWLADPDQLLKAAPFEGGLGTFKLLWIGFFDLLGRIAYQRASCITALYRGNARLQIEFGADPEKVAIVPNGIDTSRFADIAREKLDAGAAAPERVTVGFLGRVVPIKDVKTLLRAARLVRNRFPTVRFLCAGPTEEDPTYFEECLALVKQLGIEDTIEFPGRMNPADFLRQSDVVLLTSISEGLPFAILEASAAGLPVVATDVGSCRELLTFQLPDGSTPGPSGLVTEVANPTSTAAALNQLVGSREMRLSLGRNGLHRVETAYRQEDIISRYRGLYLQSTETPAPSR